MNALPVLHPRKAPFSLLTARPPSGFAICPRCDGTKTTGHHDRPCTRCKGSGLVKIKLVHAA